MLTTINRDFKGMYPHPRNSWDLRNYRRKQGETLQEYIQQFSQKWNELPNVINTFTYGTTCEGARPHAWT
jgi:hypothetical protein